MMRDTFAALLRGARRRGYAGPTRFVPSLSPLEAREVPAVVASFNAGVLTVLGDAADNTIVVGRDAAGNIAVNGGAVPITGGTPTIATTTLVRIDGQAGNDTIRMDETNGVLPAADIDGGDGDDFLEGGSGIDTFHAGGGNDTVFGRRGNDTAFLGAGDDVFVWLPGEGSDVVEGEAGFDRMDFIGSSGDETFDLSRNGTRVRFFRNLGNINMDLNQVERIDLDALGGADTVTIGDLSGGALAEFNIDLEGTLNGGAGDGVTDSVVLNGSNAAESVQVSGTGGAVSVTGLPALVTLSRVEAADALRVNGNGGNDTISATGLTTPLAFTADGGAGNDTMLGSAQVETFFGGTGNDFVDGNKGNDIGFLGAGNDVFQWDPGDGNDTIEGEAGTDEMLFNGAGVNDIVDISANGGRVRFFRNPGNVLMDTDNVEVITFNALGGADTVTVNDLTGTDVRLVRLNLGAAIGSTAPDGQPDRVVVNGTAGADHIAVAPKKKGPIAVTGLSAAVLISGTDRNALDLLDVNGLGGSDTFTAKLPPGAIDLTTTD